MATKARQGENLQTLPYPNIRKEKGRKDMVFTVKILFGEHEIEANSHLQAMEIFSRIFGENWRYLRTENEISYWELGCTTATVRKGKAKDYEAN